MNYKPVSFATFKKEALKDPKMKAGYEELNEEFALIAELIAARKMAHKTQKEVAQTMHTSQTTIARIESTAGQKRHSPTLATLRKYANAVNCHLFIKLVPKQNHANTKN